MFDHGPVRFLRTEHHDVGVFFRSDAVPGRPVEDISGLRCFFAAIAIDRSDSAIQDIAPMGTLAAVVLKSVKQFGKIGAGTEGKVFRTYPVVSGGITTSVCCLAVAPGAEIFIGISFFDMRMVSPSTLSLHIASAGSSTVVQQTHARHCRWRTSQPGAVRNLYRESEKVEDFTRPYVRSVLTLAAAPPAGSRSTLRCVANCEATESVRIRVRETFSED